MRLHSHEPIKQLIPTKYWLSRITMTTVKNVLVEILMEYLLSLMDNTE